MGHREARRVPLDFDWPLGEVWQGYLSPDWRPCPSSDCHNGSTMAGRWLECAVHLILLIGEAGISDHELHPWLREMPLNPGVKPGPDAAELSGGLAGRAPRVPFGHDAIDLFSAQRKIIEAAGLPETWGTCQVCGGHSIHPDDREAADAWEATEPPTGEGWQLWETTSEGSPRSPVFASAEELASWCEDNATVFADAHWSKDQWLRSFLGGTTDVDSLMTIGPGGVEPLGNRHAG